MRFFSFDAETDGLYGEPFAVAAVVMDEEGRILDRFCEKCEEPGVRDAWTRENCLPWLADIPKCESRAALRERFWQFYRKHRESCVIVADVPYPVEAGLLRSCVETDPGERRGEGPFPLIDVASVLFARGIDPLADRFEYSGWTGKQHHPMDDAVASCLCLIRAMREKERGE